MSRRPPPLDLAAPVDSLLAAIGLVDGRGRPLHPGGLTITALATRLGGHRSRLTNACKAEDRVQLSTLVAIAKAAGGRLTIGYVPPEKKDDGSS